MPKKKKYNPKYYYKCDACGFLNLKDYFVHKIKSLLYRDHLKRICVFMDIRCPRCNGLLTIIYDSINCEFKKEIER